jgi:hypothetical protein
MTTQHLEHSRVTKALTDNSDIDFAEAERRLRATRVVVVTEGAELSSAAAQWCLLTALNVCRRTFGSATLVLTVDVPLQRALPGAITLAMAARLMGATVVRSLPENATHAICVGSAVAPAAFCVRCWWHGWLAGIRPPWDTAQAQEGWNPLAGIVAAAIAVREVFANVRGIRSAPRATTLSLWEPWCNAAAASEGPHVVHGIRALWLIGLGHLGQGIAWSLSALPMAGRIVLQDNQAAGVENEATGLVTWSTDVGRRKTRTAARWLEHFGWETELIERRFDADTVASVDDPPIVVTALDSPAPRQHVHTAGFAYMLDIGVGHGPVDFESGQLRVFARGDAASWQPASGSKDIDRLLQRPAYEQMASKDRCGAFELADASVAVPFVGAAMGAIAVAQLARLGAMEPAIRLMQLELGAPDMPSCGAMVAAPVGNLGTMEMDLRGACTRL